MIDRDELTNSWGIFRDKMISALTGKDIGENGIGKVDKMDLSLRSVKFIPGKRAGVKEDPLKEGIIEVRPGTKGIDLGEKKYAMAYIRVLDDRHCFKGMCMYSDNLPGDYDVICYFRDPCHGLTALRTVKPEMNLGKDIMTEVSTDN